MFNNEKLLPLLILSTFIMTFGFVHNGRTQAGEPEEPNEIEIMLAHDFGKVTLVPTHNNLPPMNFIRPDQQQKQVIEVNNEQLYITPQTTFLDSEGNIINDPAKVQAGEMISFTYNEMTQEIVELRLENLNENIDEDVKTRSITPNSENISTKAKQTINFKNGVYSN